MLDNSAPLYTNKWAANLNVIVPAERMTILRTFKKQFPEWYKSAGALLDQVQ